MTTTPINQKQRLSKTCHAVTVGIGIFKKTWVIKCWLVGTILKTFLWLCANFLLFGGYKVGKNELLFMNCCTVVRRARGIPYSHITLLYLIQTTQWISLDAPIVSHAYFKCPLIPKMFKNAQRWEVLQVWWCIKYCYFGAMTCKRLLEKWIIICYWLCLKFHNSQQFID